MRLSFRAWRAVHQEVGIIIMGINRVIGRIIMGLKMHLGVEFQSMEGSKSRHSSGSGGNNNGN